MRMKGQGRCRMHRNGYDGGRQDPGRKRFGRIHSDSLFGMNPGETAIITGLPCQGKHRKRLISLGMLPGTTVTCIRTNGKSGLCIRINNSEFCIDGTIAEQIQIGRVS